MGIRIILLQVQIIMAVIMVLLLRLAIRTLPKIYSYILWILVFARLLCPVSFEVGFGIMPSWQESTEWVEQRLHEKDNVNKAAFAQGDFTVSPEVGNNGVMSPDIYDKDMDLSVKAEYENKNSTKFYDGNYDMELPNRLEINKTEQRQAGVFKALILIWFLGVAAIIGYNILALLRVNRILKSSQLFKENIYTCSGINMPFTLGVVHPRIYIPSDISKDEQDYIVCHERVHIHRKDYMIKNIAFILTSLYWFNPFVWIAFYFLERDMEMSCDEKVIKVMGLDIKKSYSQSLLNFAKGKGRMAITPLTFGENDVKERVKNVLSYKNAKRWSIALGIVILAAAGVVLFTTRSGGNENAPDTENNKIEKEEDNTIEPDHINEEAENTEASELTEYYSIDNKEEFEKLYGRDKYDFGYENTGYTPSFYLLIMKHLINGTNPEYYEQYTDPVTAAVKLLHLGEGEGSAEYDMIPINVEGIEIPWLKALSFAGEGSRAMVTYTFAQDGSTIEIVMELIEGSQGIWAPVTDDTMAREVYQTIELSPYESGGEDAVYIQTSDYGIYRLDNNGLTCLYPGYIPDSMAWEAADGRMYFPYSTSYYPGDLDYAEDTICILDINTKEVDMETYANNDELNKILPLRWISVYGGFINLYGENGKECSIPLINTGNTALSSGNVWQGKRISQLDEQEQNAYGLSLREHILENPDVLMDLSNRAFIENYTYIDMDGDGQTERISLSATPDDSGISWSYDSYTLKVGDSRIEGWAENLNNNIWAFSLDGKEIILALYEDGPSADPVTTLFMYKNGSVQNIGSFGDNIRQCEIKNGVINGTERHDVIQTDWIKAQWRVSSEGILERVIQETYDFTALNDIILSERLPVHNEPNEGSESYMLEPQTVKFLKTEDTFSWIFAEGSDGNNGWFKIDGLEIKELGLDYYEVFENLSFAD